MNKPELSGAEIGIDVSDIMFNQSLEVAFEEAFDMEGFQVGDKMWEIREWNMNISGYILIFHLDFLPTQEEVDTLTETIHYHFENK